MFVVFCNDNCCKSEEKRWRSAFWFLGSIPSCWVTFCFLPHQIWIVWLNKGGSPIEHQLYGAGGPPIEYQLYGAGGSSIEHQLYGAGGSPVEHQLYGAGGSPIEHQQSRHWAKLYQQQRLRVKSQSCFT